jgi:hypothetical protein
MHNCCIFRILFSQVARFSLIHADLNARFACIIIWTWRKIGLNELPCSFWHFRKFSTRGNWAGCTTRKILIGVDLLVADCFDAALLLRAAAWKNTAHYHYWPVGGVTTWSTALLVRRADHARNPCQNGGVVWVSRATGTVIMVAFLPLRTTCVRSMVALQNFPCQHLIAPIPCSSRIFIRSL